MIHPTAQTYIDSERRAGVADEAIRQALISAGWRLEDFDEAFNPAQTRRAPFAPVYTQDSPIISVQNVSKYFGKVHALQGVSLDIQKGGVTALLGPNGAGKTTLVRILTTLLEPTYGDAYVMGMHVIHNAQHLRSNIGMTGQFAAVDQILTGRENLEIVGRLYHLNKYEAKMRATELLSQFGLMDAENRLVKTYSGGMKRRLDLAASLIIKPKVLFLDEPTTGLDPQSRFQLWNVIRDLVKGGTTVLLTTQYLEEADELAGKIFVIDHGQIIASGTPDELKHMVGGSVLEVKIKNENDVAQARGVISVFGTIEDIPEGNPNTIIMPTEQGPAVLMNVLRALDEKNIEVMDINLRRPSLDDAFIKLTGQKTSI